MYSTDLQVTGGLLSYWGVVRCTVSPLRTSSRVPTSPTVIGLIACGRNYITTSSVSRRSLSSLTELWHLHENRRRLVLRWQPNLCQLMYVIMHYPLYCGILSVCALLLFSRHFITATKLMKSDARAKSCSIFAPLISKSSFRVAGLMWFRSGTEG